MLTTKVSAVPRSDHQRMYSSLPLGKNKSTSAKAVGRKIQRDIQIKSVSIIMSSHPTGGADSHPATAEFTTWPVENRPQDHGVPVAGPTRNERTTKRLTAASTRNRT